MIIYYNVNREGNVEGADERGGLVGPGGVPPIHH